MSTESGEILLAATPLGNSADASLRLRTALADADVIAAEDTRRLRHLLHDLQITPTGRLVSYYEANEMQRTPMLIGAAAEGATVLLVTDAGMPSVSDPGYRLVTAAIAADISLRVLPGPSAVTTALVLSGLPCDRFCFEGFAPRKAAERARYLTGLADELRTLVFFESPHRIKACLDDMIAVFGSDRRAAVCRELTKRYEQVLRGTLAELSDWAAGEVKGEITLVVAGAAPKEPPNSSELVNAVMIYQKDGLSRKDSIARVAGEFNISKRMVYETVIHSKGDDQ